MQDKVSLEDILKMLETNETIVLNNIKDYSVIKQLKDEGCPVRFDKNGYTISKTKYKKLYCIWCDSYVWDDPFPTSPQLYFMTEDYELALKEFDKCIKYCSDIKDDSKRGYSFHLCYYFLNSFPLYGGTLNEVNSIK